MKKSTKYTILLAVIFLESRILEALNIQSGASILHFMGAVLVIAPILLLFYMLSRDEEAKPFVRTVGKYGFRFFLLCIALGGVAVVVSSLLQVGR